MNKVYLISTILDIYNSVICVLMMIALLAKWHKRKTTYYFFGICASVFIFNIADLANWTCEGLEHQWYVPYLHTMTFIFYAVVAFIMIFLMKYVIEFLRPRKVVSKKFMIMVYAVSAVYLTCSVLSIFTDCFYTITPDNVYHRGKFIYLCYVLYAMYYTLSVWIVIENRHYFSSKNRFSFLSFSFFPVTAEVFQAFFYGISFVNTAMTFSILLVFLNSHFELEYEFEIQTKKTREKEKKLIKFQDHVISCLANILEERDLDTGEHAQRTSFFIQKLAEQTKADGLYQDILNDEYIVLMTKAAPLHDVGKIKIPDAILFKKGLYNPNEYEIMKLHSVEGAKIVKNIFRYSEDDNHRRIAEEIVRHHHERWDGTGYPDKLKGEEIPLCARMIAIADVYDALVSERPYKRPYSPEEAFKIMLEEEGHFDPILLQEFVKIKDEVSSIVTPNNFIEEL